MDANKHFYSNPSRATGFHVYEATAPLRQRGGNNGLAKFLTVLTGMGHGMTASLGAINKVGKMKKRT